MSSPVEREKALNIASTLENYKYCDHRGKLTIKNKRVMHEHICRACNTKIPNLAKVKCKLTTYERQLVTDRIHEANQTRYRIMDDFPVQLRRLWGQCVHSVLDSFASARTDEDAFNALKAWAKLKVVLVTPTRGGRKKRESRMHIHRRIMVQWIAGNIEECCSEGLRIEQEREFSSNNRRRRRGPKPTTNNIPANAHSPPTPRPL